MFGFLKRKERLKFACVTASEKGLVRKDNEDTAFVDEAKTVFCVADGMGGGSSVGIETAWRRNRAQRSAGQLHVFNR